MLLELDHIYKDYIQGSMVVPVLKDINLHVCLLYTSGSLIFVDLRDRTGLIQIVFDENDIGTEGFEKAGKIRSEFVLAVTGRVEKRGLSLIHICPCAY